MRFVRFILFLVSFFIFLFLFSLVLPSHVSLLKYVEINAPIERVQSQVANFDEWENWYPAFKDSNIKVIKNPPVQNVISSVTLQQVDKNIQLNLLDTTQHIIDIDLQSASKTRVSYQFILNQKSNNQTQLSWKINIDLGWLPWKKIQGIFMDKFSGQQYQVALEDLKKAVENE